MAQFLLLLSLLYVLSLKPQACCANVEADLIAILLTNYDVNARPIVNKSNPVTVNVGMVLLQIIDLDEREQKLEVKVWHRSYWHDDYLTWNPSEHGGIDRVILNPTRIWRPLLTTYDDLNQSPNDDDAALYECIVSHDGKVEWYIPKVTTISCKVDVSFYPWDEQECNFMFVSWTYDGASLDVTNMSAAVDLTYYRTSVEWSILSFDAKKNLIYYNCCPNPYPDVTFTLHIRRKSMYYVNNLIVPSIFITAIALLGFYLPPESGEKLTLSVTVLLTLFVFMLFIAESVPKSDSAPLIGLYMQILIAIISCSTALTVLTLRIHHRGEFGNKVPYWVRKVILDWLARALCMRRKVEGGFPSLTSTKEMMMPISIDSNAGDVEVISVKAIQTQNVFEVTGKPLGEYEWQNAERIAAAERKQKEEHQKACSQDWTMVAAVLDRLLLILFTIITLVASLVIFFYTPVQSDKETIA